MLKIVFKYVILLILVIAGIPALFYLFGKWIQIVSRLLQFALPAPLAFGFTLAACFLTFMATVLILVSASLNYDLKKARNFWFNEW